MRELVLLVWKIQLLQLLDDRCQACEPSPLMADEALIDGEDDHRRRRSDHAVVLLDKGWSDRQHARRLERKQKQAGSNATTLQPRAIRCADDDARTITMYGLFRPAPRL